MPLNEPDASESDAEPTAPQQVLYAWVLDFTGPQGEPLQQVPAMLLQSPHGGRPVPVALATTLPQALPALEQMARQFCDAHKKPLRLIKAAQAEVVQDMHPNLITQAGLTRQIAP